MARTDHIARPGAAAALAAALLAGCTSFIPRESPLPRDGATMTEVYRTHMGTDGTAQAVRERLPQRSADDDAVVSRRKLLSEPLNNRFERLPNPDLTMHVFPHLSKGKYPVPGYDTVFPMYEGIEYALPGEVAPRHSVKTGALDARTAEPGPAVAHKDPARKATQVD